jgi:hypothetical protein
MDNIINSLPKPILVFLVLSGVVAFFFIFDPPHTVCDTEEAAFREKLIGQIFPTVIKKNKIPPVLTRTKEACQLGNSPGSCYEYFMVLKKVIDGVGKATSECTLQLFEMSEVKATLNDGVEMMVRLAWGVKPPEPNLDRFGWLQESELALFCRMKNVYIRSVGEEGWSELRQKLFTKLPGEEIPLPSDPSKAMAEPRKANTLFSEPDMFRRSLFSVKCDAF